MISYSASTSNVDRVRGGHAIKYLIDRKLDLSGFDGRYRNDAAGATAYP
jgi:hypothetical protein